MIHFANDSSNSPPLQLHRLNSLYTSLIPFPIRNWDNFAVPPNSSRRCVCGRPSHRSRPVHDFSSTCECLQSGRKYPKTFPFSLQPARNPIRSTGRIHTREGSQAELYMFSHFATVVYWPTHARAYILFWKIRSGVVPLAEMLGNLFLGNWNRSPGTNPT